MLLNYQDKRDLFLFRVQRSAIVFLEECSETTDMDIVEQKIETLLRRKRSIIKRRIAKREKKGKRWVLFRRWGTSNGND